MKKAILIIVSLLFVTSTVFPQSKVNINILVEYGGKMFLPNDDKPFTGKVFDLNENTGEKMIEGFFRKGVKNGKWTWWNKEGLKDSSGIYNNGLKNGNWLYWDEKENKTKRGTFKKGLLLGEWYYYKYNASPAIIVTAMDSVSYSIGVDIGKNMKTQELDINDKAMFAGWSAAFNGEDLQLTDEAMLATLNNFRKVMQEKTQLRGQQQSEENLSAGEAFLAENANKEGVITVASGLQYKVLKKGLGDKPTEKSSVTVHYRGTLLNGEEFDSSYKRGQPYTTPLTNVIPGWTEALQLMPVGSKWELYIPSNLAYGNSPKGPGGPNSTLIFEVELLGIE